MLAAAFSLLLVPYVATGIDSITIDLGSVSGPDWLAKEITIALSWRDGGDKFRISAVSLNHPLLPFSLESPWIDCRKGRVNDQIICDQGKLHFNHPALKAQEIPVRFSWNNNS